MPQGGFLWKNSVPAQPAAVFLVYMGERTSGRTPETGGISWAYENGTF